MTAGALRPIHMVGSTTSTTASNTTDIAIGFVHTSMTRAPAGPARHCAAPWTATSRPRSAPAWCLTSAATAPRRSGWSQRTGGFAAAHGCDGVAQVGGDALAQPAHHVEACGRKPAQCHGHGKRLFKMPTKGPWPALPGHPSQKPGPIDEICATPQETPGWPMPPAPEHQRQCNARSIRAQRAAVPVSERGRHGRAWRREEGHRGGVGGATGRCRRGGEPLYDCGWCPRR